MKNIFFLTASFCLFTTIAQAQIPNNSFENWNSMGNYENPNSWSTLNDKTAAASVYTCTKGSPGNPGASYLKLTSKSVPGVGVVPGIAVSGVLDTTSMLPVSGFPFTSRPQNLTGKWQHMIFGMSQGFIDVKLTRWNPTTQSRITVASMHSELEGMHMSWSSFTLPLTYENSGLPDSCIIVLSASGSAPTENDYLWIDNLAFSGTPTGVKEEMALQQMSVFPNPSSQILNLNVLVAETQQLTITLTDITGKTVSSTNLGSVKGDINHTMDISTLSKGVYLLNLIGSKTSSSQKIVIE